MRSRKERNHCIWQHGGDCEVDKRFRGCDRDGHLTGMEERMQGEGVEMSERARDIGPREGFYMRGILELVCMSMRLI